MTLAFVAFIISKHNIYPLSHWLTFSHYKDHLRDTTHYLYLFHSADFLVHTEVSSLSFPIEFQVNYCIIFFKYQITMRVTSRHFTQHSEELTVLQQETPTTLCWNRVMEGRYSAQWNTIPFKAFSLHCEWNVTVKVTFNMTLSIIRILA